METSEKRPVSNSFWRALPDVGLPQRAPDMQRQQPVQFGAGERLIWRIKVDPPDHAALKGL